MTITVAELKALSLGYLTGADLVRFCPSQLLIKAYEIDNDSLQQGCDIGYGEIVSELDNRYNIDSELAKTSTERNILLVKIASILSIRNILGDAQNISDKMAMDFTWADKKLLAIRNGQASLDIVVSENPDGTSKGTYSDAGLVKSSFSTLG